MLCYLAGMELYYIKCIKDGPFKPKTAECDIKPESQWTIDEKRVVVRDQRLKSIIMSCLPDDIMESVISCETAKATWTDLIHSFAVSGFSSKGFQPKFTLKFIQSSQSPSSQAEPKIQKDYKAEYKKMKAKLALLEASPSTSQTLKTFQPKNKGLVAETFDSNEKEVSDDEEVTEVKVLMALSDAEFTIGKNPARNGEWIDISIRKEMVPKSKDWVERLNPDTKLPNFNTRRILVPKSKAVNENLKPTKGSTDPESSKDSESETITPLPPLKNIQGALPSSEVMSLTFQPHSVEERPGLGIMKHTKLETQDSSSKSGSGTVTVSETEPTTPLVPTEVKNTKQESKINELTKLVQMLIDEKFNSTPKDSRIKFTDSTD
ncbi:hypothetical protein Tco_0184881 [Tanacetum coccineum]